MNEDKSQDVLEQEENEFKKNQNTQVISRGLPITTQPIPTDNAIGGGGETVIEGAEGATEVAECCFGQDENCGCDCKDCNLDCCIDYVLCDCGGCDCGGCDGGCDCGDGCGEALGACCTGVIGCLMCMCRA